MAEARLIVGGQRDQQRSVLAQSNRDPGSFLQFRRERRPQRLAAASERDQRLLAWLGLGAGRQHAGRCMAGSRSGHALVKHRYGCAALHQPPGDGKPDDAAADHRDMRTLRKTTLCHWRLPTLA